MIAVFYSPGILYGELGRVISHRHYLLISKITYLNLTNSD